MSAEPTTQLTYIRAVNEALRWALAELPEVILYGEDVAIPGGPFGASKGLYAEYGARVFDTPISESAMIGTALGAAFGGMRPVVEVMYGDFLMVAMDQIVNQVANAHYVSNGRQRAALTIRTQQGATPGSCAQHSQSLEAFFAHVPGLRVALPSTADDAYQLLRTAIVSDDPVLVMESRRLYPSKDEVRLTVPVEDIGQARVRRPGTDATVVSWGPMLAASLAAADELAGEGVEVEVIDLRWAAPLDLDTILASAARTKVLAVAHEANVAGGLGGEIIALVAERLGPLVHSYGRVGLPNLRMPAAPTLSAAVMPDAPKIAALLRRLVTGQPATSPIHDEGVIQHAL
jgi:acetoin:2,6-dichlorophenolindophenol oxidoreductase subunit beta